MAGKKTIIDDIVFDSEFEANSYIAFKNAEFNTLERQVEFKLFDDFEYLDVYGKKRKYRNIVYTCDFLINGKYVIEIKGFQTNEYMLRKKLFIMLYSDKYFHIQLNSLKEVREFIEYISKKENLCKKK